MAKAGMTKYHAKNVQSGKNGDCSFPVSRVLQSNDALNQKTSAKWSKQQPTISQMDQLLDMVNAATYNWLMIKSRYPQAS